MPEDKLFKLLNRLKSQISRLQKKEQTSRRKLQKIKALAEKKILEAESRLSTETGILATAENKGKIVAYRSVLAAIGSPTRAKQQAPVKERPLSKSEVMDRIAQARKERDPRRVFGIPYKANEDD